MREPKQNAIQIQDEYVERVNAARSRWSHRKCGGQSHRTIGAAARVLKEKLSKWGFSEASIKQMLQDAKDIAELERLDSE
jgi:hypothetical protein